MEESPTAGSATTTPRKRIGRPPKSSSSPREPTKTADPTHADDGAADSEARSITLSPTSSECRRSSRKKIIKFDVRDLLNKSRKTTTTISSATTTAAAHKIQIEARIDSNASPSKGAAAAPPPIVLATSENADAANRRFSMFEASTVRRQLRLIDSKPVPLPLPLPAHSLDIFAKPKATQSLIVAQVSSGDETGVCRSTFLNALSPTAQSVQAMRKRGRPRKAKAQAVELNGETQASAPESSIPYSFSDSTNGSSNGSCESDSSQKSRRKLRVALKRLKMPIRNGSFDSTESLKSVDSPLGISVLDVSSSSSAGRKEPDVGQQLLLAVEDENALDANFVPQAPELARLAVLEEQEEDSDSQIIFVEIETAHQEGGSPALEAINDENDDTLEQRSFQQLFEQQQQNEEQENLIDEIVICSPSTLTDSGEDGEQDSSDSMKVKATDAVPAVTGKRRSQRSSMRSRGVSTSNKKRTLEETYAEITKKMYKQIRDAEAIVQANKLKRQEKQPEVLEAEAVAPVEATLQQSAAEEQPAVEVETEQDIAVTSEAAAEEPVSRSEQPRTEIEDEENIEIQLETVKEPEIQLEIPFEAPQAVTVVAVMEEQHPQPIIPAAPVIENEPQQVETSVRRHSQDSWGSAQGRKIRQRRKTIASRLQMQTDCDSNSNNCPVDASLPDVDKNPVEAQVEQTSGTKQKSEETQKIMSPQPAEEAHEEQTAQMAEEKAEEPRAMISEELLQASVKVEDDYSPLSSSNGIRTEQIETPPPAVDAQLLKSPVQKTAGQKTAAQKATTPEAHKSDKDKQRSLGFVECDALFKAIDKASAQMRLEEKSKKKQKLEQAQAHAQAHAKKQELSKPISDLDAGPTKVDSTSSDSSRVSTPNLSECGSSSSAKRAQSKKKTVQESRRNTMCEERPPSGEPLMKRRYSVHPKVSPTPRSADGSPLPLPKLELLQPQEKPQSQKKKIKQPNSESSISISRQGSFDSNSSASQSAFSRSNRNRKTLTPSVNEALQLALTETESSESTSSSCSKMQRFLESSSIHTPASSSPACTTPELEAPDPLKDIAKFIEDGVNLLKRDYKLDDDDEEELTRKPALPTTPTTESEFAARVAQMETPAMTPESTPAVSPSATPVPPNEETDVVLTSGVRRSHRIKQKPQGPKASVGRGVVRDKERLFTSDDGDAYVAPLSMEDQLMELAQIEAINEQFLRSEGLNSFQMIRENYYRCARQVSQENAEMQCDCFLTGDEEAQGHLCCGAGCINRMLMIECGPLCTNGDRCTNKRFQKRQCWPCRVFRTEKKGCGITAELQIPPGEFVMEYVGEVIDSEEFERRQHLYSHDKNRHYYFMALRGEAIIDATAKGNISRYINHSCDPNAETQKWTVNGELRIGFFSLKTIMPGEEITFDYQYQRYGRDAQRCYCEAANCRGWIGGEPDSDEGEQLDADADGDSDSEEEYEEELEQGSNSGEATERRKSLISARKLKEPKSKVKLKLAGRKRKPQEKNKDKEYKAGRWLRPSSDKTSRKPSKVKFRATLEDPDVLEELSVLSRCSLKNQVDTLRFSRCMVRAKLLQTRIQLLGVLTRGELPCRRLFLDYHGLRLLHAWMNESGSDHELRLTLLEALESLPIPNRTMLNDSRVYQSVKVWSDADGNAAQLSQRMLALLQKWDALPEIFRIPKRERFEQMKEHEREADRQYAATALEDSNNATAALASDRYRQDRFRRDTAASRYVKPKPAMMSGNNTICTITTQPTHSGHKEVSMSGGSYKGESRRRSEVSSVVAYDRPSKHISKELRRELFERKVAQDEAEKRVSSEDWREHGLRCEYFGVDLTTDPKLLPFYHNTETDEWFNSEDVQVPAPLRCGNGNEPELPVVDELPQPVDLADYKLPASVEPLPAAWHWSITGDGHIYYYNLRERITQWEPPTTQQRLQTLQLEPEVSAEEATALNSEQLLISIDADHVGSLSPRSLSEYIESKIRERRELRRSCLESVCVISPRREEDRIYNQIESRKYKENKEKIRRRKEVFRRRATSDQPAPVADTEACAPLPIQGYLFSSDEESNVDEPNGDAGGASSDPMQPLIDAIVDSDKNVDELDALSSRRPLPPLSMEPSTSKSALAALATLSKKRLTLGQEIESDEALATAITAADAATLTLSNRAAVVSAKRKSQLPMPPLPENKRHRLDREKRRKNMSSTASGREATEKFRTEISAHVAEFLRPYRKESSHIGRITCDEDYKFLIKRLSHHITTKEMRYCDSIGNLLACTESVKHKSYDFINQYMRKKGKVYKRPADEPDQ